MTNIQVVDTIVRQTEALFTEFYGDEDTAFVFTADHGMTVIGNHGDSSETYYVFSSLPVTNVSRQILTIRGHL